MGHAVSARRSIVLGRADPAAAPALAAAPPGKAGEPLTTSRSATDTDSVADATRGEGVLGDFDISPTDGTMDTGGAPSGGGGGGGAPFPETDGSMDEYDPMSVAGRGAFAYCHVVRRKRDGLLLVMKTMLMPLATMSQSELANLRTEVDVMRRLEHPSIVRYADCFVHEDKLRIVMEYATEGTVHAAVQKMAASGGATFPEGLIWEWAVQLLAGLDYIHDRGIVHRDVKPLNLLLTGSERRIVKIADFGIAKVLAANEMAQSLVGTPHYLSPEVCRGEAYDAKADIWALGCVLFEVMSLTKAFRGRSVPGLLMSILSGRYGELPAAYSEELRLLVQAMLALNAEDRPTARQLLELPAVKAAAQRWNASAPRPPTPRTPPGQLNVLGREDFERNVKADAPLSPSEPPISVRISGDTEDESKGSFGAAALGVPHNSPHVGGAGEAGAGSDSDEEDNFFGGAEARDVRGHEQRAQPPQSPTSQLGRDWMKNRRAFRWSAATSSPEMLVQMAEVDLAAVACGGQHFVACSTAGAVYVYGDNAHEQLGLPHLSDTHASAGEELSAVPRLELPGGAKAVRVAAGARHSACVGAGGELFAWGAGFGATPALVREGGVADVACGADGLTVVRCAEDGAVLQLQQAGGERAVELRAPAVDVAVGGAQALAALEDGSVWAWEGDAAPTQVPLPEGARAAAVAAGDSHALVLTTAGGVLAWGQGACGQLGLGEGVTAAAEPTPVDGLADVEAVSCGAQRSLARRADGALFVWGAGGCKGTECRRDVPEPLRLRALGDVAVAAVAAGPEDVVVLVAPR